jgi:hypothetical protein
LKILAKQSSDRADINRRSRLRFAALAWPVVLSPLPAIAADLAKNVTVNHGALAYDSQANTYDTTVTVTNTSKSPVTGPLRVSLANTTSSGVAIYNGFGRQPDGSTYVEIQLPDGLLNPSVSATGIVKLMGVSGGKSSNVDFRADGLVLDAEHSGQVMVQGFLAAGPGMDQKGATIGAGYQVRINGYARGATDATGRLSLALPAGVNRLDVMGPDGLGAHSSLFVPAGSKSMKEVLVAGRSAGYAAAQLRFDQVRDNVLPRSVSGISLRLLANETPIRLARVDTVDVAGIDGATQNIKSLFTLGGDGTLSANSAAFFAAMGARKGKNTVTVTGADAQGREYSTRTSYYLADYRARVQLVAPPSNPNLQLQGIRVSGQVLNSDLRFTADSDANGYVLLPDIPASLIKLTAQAPGGSVIYLGLGSIAIDKDSLVRLTLRAPIDVTQHVTGISVTALPPKGGRELTPGDAKPIYSARHLAKRQALASQLEARGGRTRGECGRKGGAFGRHE